MSQKLNLWACFSAKYFLESVVSGHVVMPTFKTLICITQLSSRKVLSILLVYIALRACEVKTDVFTSLKNLCQFP